MLTRLIWGLLLAPAHAPDSGGWAGAPAAVDPLASPVACSIERADAAAVSAAQFEAVYFGKKPLIIIGAVNSSTWPAFRRWRKQTLLESYGDRKVLVRTAPSSCLTDDTRCVADGDRSLVPLAQYAEAFDVPRRPAASTTVPYTHDRHLLAVAVPELRDDFSAPPQVNWRRRWWHGVKDSAIKYSQSCNCTP